MGLASVQASTARSVRRISLRQSLSFTVNGTPITQGSKSVTMRAGRPVLMDRNNMKSKTMPADRLTHWRENVARIAASAMQVRGWTECRGNVELSCTFHFTRPKSHMRPDGTVRAAFASKLPRGDLDKYLRAIGDSLSGIVYKDDAQIRIIRGEKLYTVMAAFALITVVRL